MDLFLELEKHVLAEEAERNKCIEKNDEEFENEECENDDYIFLKSKVVGSERTNDLLFKLFESMNIGLKIQNCAKKIYSCTISDPKFFRVKFKNAILAAAIYLAFQINGDFRDNQWIIDYFKISKPRFVVAMRYIKTVVPETRIIRPNLQTDFFAVLRKLQILDDKPTIDAWISDNEWFAEDLIKKQKQKYFSMLYVWLIKNKTIIPTLENYSKICCLSKKSMYKTIVVLECLVMEDFIKRIVENKIAAFANLLAENFSNFETSCSEMDFEIINYKKIFKNLLK